jgi:PAS domain S-box-containing protein
MTSAKLARLNYAVRTGAFAWCFLTIGIHMLERGYSWPAWALLAAQFLVYPHVMYLRASRSPRPNRAERDNLFLDSVFLGIWAAALGFPLWISYNIVGSALLNAVINRGGVGMLWAALSSVGGAILWGLIDGFRFEPQTSDLVTWLCVLGSVTYVSTVGYVVFRQTHRLSAARDELALSEDRYRLIAENAADLIGMVDAEGRWLYTSPAYDRLLAPAHLAPGVDAFARMHPDDAERGRSAVRRAATTGRSKDLALRLIDFAGRIRQFKTHVHAVAEGVAPHRVVLVSQDVTDLREREERLLLAAHALEGLTEAIMITAADGTIVTVNRAFTELTGYTRDDVLGQPEKSVRNALQPPEYYDELFAVVRREGHWSGTTWSRRKNGSVYREWRSVRAVKEDGGAVTHYVMLFYEVGAGQARPDSAARPA